VEWRKWLLSRRSVYRQGARERPSGRYHDCAGGIRDQGRKVPNPGKLTSLRLKGAETEATKRALATFGNPFGLALYDREQLGVRKARTDKASLPVGPWVLRSAIGDEEASFDKSSEFAGALRKAMSEANDIKVLFAIWEQNVETVRALNRA
jgi:Rad52/22 family double-strand break repair protein